MNKSVKTKKKKSWREKLHDSHDLPKVVKITGKMVNKWGEGTLAIPSPKEVDEIIKKVPKGKLITINQIREKVAKKHGATTGCPITSGIFAWISAYAADEDEQEGKKNITPYWRALKGEGELNPKYPGGVPAQTKRLKEEGHIIEKKGKNKVIVKDYEKFLVKA